MRRSDGARKRTRLTRSADFAAVMRRGRRRSDGLLALTARRNGLCSTRFGFSVGKRVGKAVVRNSVRRRIKEAARLTPVRPGWDIVVSARSAAADAGYHRLSRSLSTLLRRLDLLDAPIPGSAPPASGVRCSG